MVSSCEECHRAKVKCSMKDPCTRCERLGIVCVPRISRQGQKRPASAVDEESTGETIIAGSSIASYGNQHYGINVVIRKWVATAFRRRSLALLGKAAQLAAKAKISMDQIFCSNSFPQSSGRRPMAFLADLICQDTSTASPVDPVVEPWEEFPEVLRCSTWTLTLNGTLISTLNPKLTLTLTPTFRPQIQVEDDAWEQDM